MTRRRRIRVGLAVAASTTLATALLTGVVTEPGRFLGGVVGPRSAAAGELPAFGGCEELRQWYVAAALPHVTAWGLGGGWWGPVASEGARAGMESLAGAADAPVASGPTGTNVQEAGVDEPDVAKTDGAVVAHVEGRRLVLTDTSGDEPRTAGTLRLPRDMAGGDLLWVGDRLVLMGRSPGVWPGPVLEDVGPHRPGMPYGGVHGETRVLVVDVEDVDEPEVLHDATYSGTLLSARQYDDVVRLVVSTTSPAIDFVTPRRGRTPREALTENRRLLRESTLDAWLPTVESSGSSRPLVKCSEVRHPEGRPDRSSGYGTVSVVAFTATAPDDRRTTAVTTASDLVYSSPRRLYFALPAGDETRVHAFALAGRDTSYVATGKVAGHVRDRWSMSEHDGYLRVATALGPESWDPRENAVVVMEERGAALVEVGRVARMGVRESIRSVRWFGDLAVVVTFRQIDPLYTIDLSDPTAPRVMGELKIPGFSAYLHPLGEGLLLGLGQDADRRGRIRGAQASVFDLRDLAAPRRVATVRFRRDTEFAASWDPRSFTYLPERRIALAPVHSWRGVSRLVVLRVSQDGALTDTAVQVPAGWHGTAVRTLPLDQGRVALVSGGRVRLLTLDR